MRGGQGPAEPTKPNDAGAKFAGVEYTETNLQFEVWSKYSLKEKRDRRKIGNSICLLFAISLSTCSILEFI